MRLIACPDCHSQYDVTHTHRKLVTCKCGTEIANELVAAAEFEVHRCSSCSAQVSGNATHCDYCGASINRDTRALSMICPECCARNADAARFCGGCGVSFEPQALPDEEGVELPCPDCLGLMPVRRIGGVAINECPKCNGIWAPGDRFEELVQRAIDAQTSQVTGEVENFEARAKMGKPTLSAVKYRKCPECDAHMQRRNFRKTSGVIIDRCGHGVWLDCDELEQIAGFLLSGGRPQAARALADAERSADESYRGARLENIAATYGVSSTPTRRRESSPLAAGIAAFFESLFD